MFRWERQKSGEGWLCDRRILAAAAEFPPPLRLLIADRLELLAEMGRSPSEADMAATFAGFPPPEADVLLRLWLAFSYERLTAIAEWGEARPEMKGKMGEAQRYDMLAGLLTAAPQRPDSDWVDTVTWLTNLLAEMPETMRQRLRRLIESEVGQFENDDQRSSEPAESVEPPTAPRGRMRSEAEIADLVPYVSESVVDAVRDALRKVVLENQDHSEMLDKLLPQLQQMPSRRSEALDWLDVELSRLSDDAIIELIGKMKHTGGKGMQLKPETGGSAPSDDQPPVEPETVPRRSHPLRGAAVRALAASACLAVAFTAGPAIVPELFYSPPDPVAMRAEIEAELRAESRDTAEELERLRGVADVVRRIYGVVLDGRASDSEQALDIVVRGLGIAIRQLDRIENGEPIEIPP